MSTQHWTRVTEDLHVGKHAGTQVRVNAPRSFLGRPGIFGRNASLGAAPDA